jgi:hypothetical protein
MWSQIMNLVSTTIKPIGEIIDNLNTSEEEKLAAKRAMEQIQNQLTTKMIDLQQKELEAKKEVVVAEAKSEHFLTSAWRPITALVFTFIIANNYIIAPYTEALFDVKVMFEIPPQMWNLLKIMIGGYVLSRGVEKTASQMKKER